MYPPLPTASYENVGVGADLSEPPSPVIVKKQIIVEKPVIVEKEVIVEIEKESPKARGPGNVDPDRRMEATCTCCTHTSTRSTVETYGSLPRWICKPSIPVRRSSSTAAIVRVELPLP